MLRRRCGRRAGLVVQQVRPRRASRLPVADDVVAVLVAAAAGRGERHRRAVGAPHRHRRARAGAAAVGVDRDRREAVLRGDRGDARAAVLVAERAVGVDVDRPAAGRRRAGRQPEVECGLNLAARQRAGARRDRRDVARDALGEVERAERAERDRADRARDDAAPLREVDGLGRERAADVDLVVLRDRRDLSVGEHGARAGGADVEVERRRRRGVHRRAHPLDDVRRRLRREDAERRDLDTAAADPADGPLRGE